MMTLATVAGRLWAVDARLYEHIRAVLEVEGFAGLRHLAELRRMAYQQDGPQAAAPRPSGASGVYVIPIVGLMTQRGDQVESAFTFSTAALVAELRAAAANQAVGSIVLEVDSPGGDVYGIAEAAQAIREVRAQKPVIAVANSLAASAGYWLASQANELLVTPSGEVGSIGVYAAHVDVSGEMAQRGRKVSYVYAGKYKIEGNPVEPLQEEARAEMQRSVDRYYGLFVTDVAKGRSSGDRRIGVDQVRDEFGEGRVVGARRAVELQMADDVGTLDDAIRRAGSLSAQRRREMAALAAVQAAQFVRERS